jgi:hypothetical protein
MDELMGAAIGPFIEDMTALMATYDQDQIRAISDWVSRTTEVLVTNTRRVMTLREE